ncbi:MAG TPA: TlpA family protein disulfide reductase [Gammaproteobacteria bacterium]|nr:TlpA family protein disulfide reductase [Gammaproteobacteria bacterium]
MKVKIAILSLSLLLISCSKPDLLDSNGNGIFLNELNQKWLIVNYWATWCGPCIAEIPELNELSKQHEELITLLGVNFDNPTAEEMAAQIKKMKIEFPVLSADPSEVLKFEIPQVLPTTFIFEPGGQLVKTLVGPQTKQSIMEIIDARSSVPGQ